MTYCAIEPFVAVVYDQPRQFNFVTIDAGSIMTVKGEVHRSGLVSVLCDGQIVAVFRRDIETKAEIVDSEVWSSVGSSRE
jgi:hypothetical protein